MENPYFRSFKPITDPDSDPRLMLVGRLDGPSAGDVLRMIDDSLRAELRSQFNRELWPERIRAVYQRCGISI